MYAMRGRRQTKPDSWLQPQYLTRHESGSESWRLARWVEALPGTELAWDVEMRGANNIIQQSSIGNAALIGTTIRELRRLLYICNAMVKR